MINEIGYIYKITNNFNKNSYIGKTQNYYELRWRDHKARCFNKKAKTYQISLYKAFRKYGLENFSFEVIETCPITILNERECYWISYYNTYYNGYNETLGGDGGKLYSIDEAMILSLYEKYKTIKAVEEETGYYRSLISSVLKKHNVKIISAVEHQKQKSLNVAVYSKEKVLLKVFNSRSEIGEWLLKNNLTTAKTPLSAGCKIINNLKNDIHECCDLLWFYTNNNNISSYKLKNNSEQILNKLICPTCGKKKHPTAKQCMHCYNIIKKKSSKIVSKDVLQENLKNLSFVSIGKKYGVSDNTIRKWCKKYDLPYKKHPK